jgi:hypothetical protein
VYESVCASVFPTTRAAWASSLSCMLIERFRIYLARLPPGLVDSKVDEAIRLVFKFVAALGALDHITFDKDPDSKAEETDPFFKGKQSQKKHKAGGATRARQNMVVVDLFALIDFDVPTTPGELGVSEIDLLHRLRELLEV